MRPTRIAAVAYSHGFVEQAHFTRAFRRRFGCTPTQWRHEGRAGGQGGQVGRGTDADLPQRPTER